MNNINYEEFKTAVMAYAHGKYGNGEHPKEIVFLTDGFTASDEKTKALIEDTNLRYGHTDAERLIGDFIIISTEAELGGCQCRFEVRGLFREYRAGGWEAVYQIMAENIAQTEKIGNSPFSLTDGYDAICGRLIVCMRNVRKNALERKGLTYRQMDDMAMTLYAIAQDDSHGNRLIAPVPRIIVQEWHKSDEEIFDAALKNTAKLSPARAYYGVDDMISGGDGGCDFMCALKPVRRIPNNPFSLTVSASPTSDGATAMFYPGVQQRLAEMAGGDYFVVFSAKDEAHIHRATGITAEALKSRLRDMNTAFASTMLTENIYLYEAGKKVMRKV